MSNRSTRAKRAIVDFDSSQPPSVERSSSKRTTQKTQKEIDASENKVHVSNCVRFILLHEYTKIPVKQNCINKYLRENHSLKDQDICSIMEQVRKLLRDNFGFSMVETLASGSKAYVLQNLYNCKLLCLGQENTENSNRGIADDFSDDSDYDPGLDANSDHINTESFTYEEILDNAKRTLLLITVSLIILDESEAIPEKKLIDSLKEVGLDLDGAIETCHDLPKSTIRKVVCEEFVRKAYLKKTKKTYTDGSVQSEYVYELGIRSELEFKRSDILKFLNENVYKFNDAYLNQLLKKNTASQNNQTNSGGADEKENPSETNTVGSENSAGGKRIRGRRPSSRT